MAKRVCRACGDIEVVRAALGHASVATTVRYARAEESVVRSAIGA
jgi:site-specific recombinase XerD